MLTVNHDPSAVESDLAAGSLSCPRCQGVLRPWGWARVRLIRQGTDTIGDLVTVRPRRTRCTGCAGTHVLLAVHLAARRADTAAVIALAIEAKTTRGAGHRRIAARLDRPASTVRGWLRAFTTSAAAIAAAFTTRTVRDGPDAAGLWPAPAPSVAGTALAAVAAYAGVLANRFAVAVLPWQTAALAAAGPFFFSPARWRPDGQHESALMSGVSVSEGDKSVG